MDYKAAEDCLLDLNRLFQYRRIPFFLIQGTALGAYRDNGFAPRDVDIDLGILIEHLLPHFHQVLVDLQESGFLWSTRSKPFSRERIIVAKRAGVKIDITTYVPWKEFRFCANTDPALHYSVVYRHEMMETYDVVKVFGKCFRVPAPVEEYLQLEYGEDWRTPKPDSTSRTRRYYFVRKERIPHDWLDQFASKHSHQSSG